MDFVVGYQFHRNKLYEISFHYNGSNSEDKMQLAYNELVALYGVEGDESILDEVEGYYWGDSTFVVILVGSTTGRDFAIRFIYSPLFPPN